MSGKYDDIICLPHHVSATRPQMAIRDRAAQFSPFAALTGYESALQETARLTEKRIELDDSAKDALGARLHALSERLNMRSEVAVTWFQPDEKKSGGRYLTSAGVVRKIDEYRQLLILEDKTEIPLGDIVGIDYRCSSPESGGFIFQGKKTL